MVVLNKIYTRTGDAGTTALGTGERVAKDTLRIKAYGTVDETNAALGLAVGYLGTDDAETLDRLALDRLTHVQNDLFDLGADLCMPEKAEAEDGDEPAFEALRINQHQVQWLEDQMDAMNAVMKPLRSFVLPGGSQAAAALHMARTISRRAERHMVALARQPDEPVSQAALKYINRVSDFFFVASRFVNDHGKADVLWVPGKNR